MKISIAYHFNRQHVFAIELFKRLSEILHILFVMKHMMFHNKKYMLIYKYISHFLMLSQTQITCNKKYLLEIFHGLINFSNIHVLKFFSTNFGSMQPDLKDFRKSFEKDVELTTCIFIEDVASPDRLLFYSMFITFSFYQFFQHLQKTLTSIL